jgi:ribosomal protein S8
MIQMLCEMILALSDTEAILRGFLSIKAATLRNKFVNILHCQGFITVTVTVCTFIQNFKYAL